MASHSHTNLDNDRTQLTPGAKTLGIGLMVAGLIALVAAVVVTVFMQHQTQRFFFSYLFGIAGFLAISCASLIFVLIKHLVRAGWITNVRRILETFAAQLPLLSILLLPIVATVIWQNGIVYSWAKPTDTPIVHHGAAHHEEEPGHEGHGHAPGKHDEHAAGEGHGADDAHAEAHGSHALPSTEGLNDRNATQSPDARTAMGPTNLPEYPYPNEQVQPGVWRAFDSIIAEKNHGWLNPIIWTVRTIAYLVIVSGIAVYLYRNSVRQDATGDIDITSRLMKISAPLLMTSGLIVTFIAFDVFMSLDPHWFSTMFGVYFFASGTQAMWALLALTLILLQKRGYLRESVNTEHYHDIGKFLWAFVFFFGYIAFSQYMLQWYANMPEETFWYDKRGYSTYRPNGYSPLVLILVICRFVIPFLGLISRHVKRNRFGLGFWAAWLLVCFFIDMYLLVMPEFAWVDRGHLPPFGLPEILCLLGVGALWFGNSIRMLATHALRPVRDPRVHESLAIANI